MIGAIIGDIAGSRFEHHNIKTKDFELLMREQISSALIFTVEIYGAHLPIPTAIMHGCST